MSKLMRLNELLVEEVIKAEIDWQQFQAAMAASAITRNVPRGIDAIVYLGIIGDPGSQVVNVQMRRAAQIGVDVSSKNKGYFPASGNPDAAAMYFNSSPTTFTGINGKEGLRVGQDFDILINYEGSTAAQWAQNRSHDSTSNLVAHELMHRGLDIADNISQIRDQIAEPSKNYFAQRRSKSVPGLVDPDDPVRYKPGNPAIYDNLEHLMIYAMLDTSHNFDHPKFRDTRAARLASRDKIRQVYLDVEAAAKRYILSYPIPKGSLAALRSELDGITPDNVDVKVGIGANDTPVVVLTSQPVAQAVPSGSSSASQSGVKDSVMAIQDKLKKLGTNLGTSGPNRDGVDGTLSDKTIQAIRSYLTQKLSGQ